MKKFSLLLLVLPVICGCDSFRKMAGRPTSVDIQAKRELIAAHEQAEQARQAELEEIRRLESAAIADSLAAVDSISVNGIELRGPGNIAAVVVGTLDSRYYVIVGAYRSAVNAANAAASFEACGFTAVTVTCSNGNTIVAACPCNRLSEVYGYYRRLKKLPFCPSASWILDLAQ